ncbi:MAG: DUF2723 domain-containing protein, partial [Myxococcota bacterium]|nr:DUF2723 domain-containing protein [Myxococcota bacterium]
MLDGESRADHLLRAGVGLLAFSAYVLTAAPGAFWLDSGELAAAGVTLGIAHPPGHPLYVVLAYIASWIPLGSAGFRVTLLSGAMGALAALFLYDLVLMLARETGEDDADEESWSRIAAAFAALVLALSAGVWLQAVRAEVYTLQLALHLWITREVLRWYLCGDRRSNASLWRAALGVGLGLANHHLLMVAHIPALLILFMSVREERVRAPRILGQGALWATWGLGIYAMLPVRAATSPILNYGDPSELGRFVDVVTAQVFQSSVTGASPSLLENLSGAIDMYIASIGPLVLGISLLGFGWLAGKRPLVAGALVVALVCNLATKVSMVLDPTNPDAAGYFQTGLAVMSIAGGLGLYATLRAVRRPSAQLLITALFVMTSGAQSWASMDRLNLNEHRSPMATDMLLVSSAAPNGLWLTSFYGLHFNRLYHVAVDGFRPDVTCIHQGFEGHVNGGRSVGEAHRKAGNHVDALTDAFEQTGEFPASQLQEMAGHRAI